MQARADVEINDENFPDENFRIYLLQMTYGQDGILSDSEIAEIKSIIEGYQYVSLIKGVATSPSVPDILRRPVVASTKRKLFKVIDTLHPIP